ncbi:hypothetical protein JYT83_00060 [bacterium AH-315-F18]|nr:hypothetical protein [bacterium AH-315-F18]
MQQPLEDTPERQIEQLYMLSQGGAELNALRGAIALTRRLSNTLEALATPGSLGDTPLRVDMYRLLCQVRTVQTNCRAKNRLLKDLNQLEAWGPEFAPLVGEIHQNLKVGGPESDSDREQDGNFIALIELVGHQVGLAVPWPCMANDLTADPEALSLDFDGEQQERAAKRVISGLADPEEIDLTDDFNNTHYIVPLAPLSSLRLIEGASTGLPTLLAMIQRRFDLTPNVGTAASGVIDLSKMQPGSETTRDEGSYFQFLTIHITQIEAVEEKIYAALDQHPEVERIILPAANQDQVEANLDLCADLEQCNVVIRYVSEVGDLFKDPKIFNKTVFAPRLRLDPEFSESEAKGIERWTGILITTCTIVLAECALLFAYGYWRLST